MPRHVTQTEAHQIIADSMDKTVPELAEIYKRTVTTIQRVLDNPKYAEFKQTCEDKLRQITLDNAYQRWKDEHGDPDD